MKSWNESILVQKVINLKTGLKRFTLTLERNQQMGFKFLDLWQVARYTDK
jgi:hypothetical protein